MKAQDTVGHLRVHRPAGLALADPVLRLRVQRQVEAIDLRPARLPPAAILIVRRLTVRTAAVDSPWNQGQITLTRRHLDGLLAQAARPVLAPPRNDASCVLFTDPAELLVCLTRDVLHGRHGERWYWRQVLGWKMVDATRALATCWCEEAIFAPMALRLLSIWERQAFVERLGAASCSVVTRALHDAYAIPSAPLEKLLSPPLSMPQSPVAIQSELALIAPSFPAAPWRDWFATSDYGSSTVAQTYLLGLGLTLAYAPAYARSVPFQQAALLWLDAALNHPLDRTPVYRTEQTLPDSFSSARLNPAAGSSESNVLDRSFGNRPVPTGSVVRLADDSASLPSIKTRPVAPGVHPPPVQAPARQQDGVESAPEQSIDTAIGVAVDAAADGVETALAGVFYLANFLLWLGLPGAAHTDGIDARLGAWGMLEAWARLLLDASATVRPNDPVWTALATLDSRPPGALLGADLQRARDFRLPLAWVRRWQTRQTPWIAGVVRGRLRLADPVHGVLIADVALAGRTDVAAAVAEIERYQAAGLDANFVLATPPPLPRLHPATRAALDPALAWWLRRGAGFVRVALALRLHCAPSDLDQVVTTLLCRRGRLAISRTHVDLYLTLAQIDMAARRSGLDQDPDWAPDFGRIIYFHFE